MTTPKAKIKHAKRQAAEVEARMARLVERGRWRAAMRLQRIYVGSTHAAIAAASKANMKMPRDLRLSSQDVLDTAAQLNPWRGTRERAVVYAKRKRSGGVRPIVTFGVGNKALQYLAVAAMRPFARLHPGQHALRGTQAAVGEMLDAMAGGLTHVTVSDIKNCYGSLDPDAVVRLAPLPRAVAENVLVSRGINLVSRGRGNREGRASSERPSLAGGVSNAPATRGETTQGASASLLRAPSRSRTPVQLIDLAQRGIPQGSAASNLVCEIMLAPVMDALPANARVVAYADDVVMFAQTEAGARRNESSLGSAFRRCPAGLLTEKHMTTTTAEAGFTALGYRIDMKRGAPRARPTRVNLWRFEKRLERCSFKILMDMTMCEPLNRRDIDDLLARARGWAANFSAWPFARAYTERYVREFFELPPAPGDLKMRLIRKFESDAWRWAA